MLALSRIMYTANAAVTVLLKGLQGEEISRMQYWCAKAVLETAAAARAEDLQNEIDEIRESLRELSEEPE